MNYDVLINGNSLFSGSLYTVALVVVLLGIIFWIIGKILWKRIKSNEDLKYEFVTIIAHKFRTPLTQTKWVVESMIAMEEDSFKKESLKNIDTSNEKLISLTNTLVEITDSASRKRAQYDFERINLCELTNKIANSLTEEFHKKNIFFGIQCSDSEIYVKADRQRLEFVLQTIIENSVNYTPTGQNVDVVVIKKGNKALVQVTDNGIGIDPKELPNIFTKFYRSQSAQTMDTEGFGIGLFLARSVVQKHKGKIEVNSAGLGSGSTFTIILPLVK